MESARATSKAPLDDAAFFYFARTVPLEVGKRYEVDRYFRPDRNPVVLEVLARDTIDAVLGRDEARRRPSATADLPLIGAASGESLGSLAGSIARETGLSDRVVRRLVDRHGAQVAFPTSTLHVPEGVAVRPADGAARKAADAGEAADAAAARAADRRSDA